MRSSNMFARSDQRGIWAFCAIASTVVGGSIIACSSSATNAAPSTSTCAFQMGGAFNEPSTTLPKCVTLNYQEATDADETGNPSAAGWVLTIDGSASDGSQILVSINLGATPASGDYSSEISGNWFASIDNRLDSGAEALEAAAYGMWSSQCVYIAGTSWVPSGSFALHLDSITTTGNTNAHGTLSVVTYAHAPTAGNCGPSEIETVALSF